MKHVVRAVSCDYRSTREQVYEALKRASDPLTGTWDRLSKARTIAIKFNQNKMPERVVMYEGQRQQLVSDSVVYAVLRLLRERTGARLFCADVSFYTAYEGSTVEKTTQIAPLLEEFEVEYLNGNEPPFVEVPVPGSHSVFKSYQVIEGVAAADEVVSVAKMKNHKFMGITGCLKNLFGLSPVEPYGRPRPYYHHLIRMPYMLTDLGKIYDPVLNVVDGMICQAGSEWWGGNECARIMNTIMAGDHPVAVDACMARLMGHDPAADWPAPPFQRDRNALLAAEEAGYGSVGAEGIDFETETEPAAEGIFYSEETDTREMIDAWRESMCRQALYYRDNGELFEQYANEYILLQKENVVWHSPNGWLNVSRRSLAGKRVDQSLFFKFVDPLEREEERFEVYERALEYFAESGR